MKNAYIFNKNSLMKYEVWREGYEQIEEIHRGILENYNYTKISELSQEFTKQNHQFEVDKSVTNKSQTFFDPYTNILHTQSLLPLLY
jgi:hypothetical protein